MRNQKDEAAGLWHRSTSDWKVWLLTSLSLYAILLYWDQLDLAASLIFGGGGALALIVTEWLPWRLGVTAQYFGAGAIVVVAVWLVEVIGSDSNFAISMLNAAAPVFGVRGVFSVVSRLVSTLSSTKRPVDN